jgi:hypothetical protein
MYWAVNLAGGVTQPIHIIDQVIEHLGVSGENEILSRQAINRPDAHRRFT